MNGPTMRRFAKGRTRPTSKGPMLRRRSSMTSSIISRDFSEREARASHRTPETLQVVGRRGAGPGAAVVVAVNAAGDGLAVLCQGGGPAKAAHRRPVRHRRRRRRVEAREAARGIDDPTADDRQLGDGVGNLALGTREIVAVRDDEVGELAGLDASLLAFLVGEPGRVLGP